MAVVVTLSVSPTSPNHGQTVTATYGVSGNVGTPGETVTIGGQATIGGQVIDVGTTLTLPGSGPAPETFAAPTGGGLTFTGTSNPRVFTALVP